MGCRALSVGIGSGCAFLGCCRGGDWSVRGLGFGRLRGDGKKMAEWDLRWGLPIAGNNG